MYKWKTLLSPPLGIYLEKELLNHMAAVFLNVWGTAVLCFTEAATCYLPACSVEVFQLLHVFTKPAIFCSFICLKLDILSGVRCYLRIVWIPISLMISHISNFFCLFWMRLEASLLEPGKDTTESCEHVNSDAVKKPWAVTLAIAQAALVAYFLGDSQM